MNIINCLNSFELLRTKTVEYKKDSILFDEDEKCELIGIIESGQVEISTYLSNGEKVIYNTLNIGDIFGANLVFSSEPYYKGSVVATSDCRVRIIGKNDLKIILQQNDKFLENFLQIQSNFTKKLNYKIKLLSMNSAVDRVMFAISSQKNKELRFKSVTALADSLGLTREATSRTISKLEKEGKILLKNKIISLKNSE